MKERGQRNEYLFFFSSITENTSFVVWEMFPGKDEESAESGEEEDYYFSDD